MTPLAYVTREGLIGMCCDEELQQHVRETYTTHPIHPRKTGWIIGGMVPRPLLVAAQVRRMLRADEEAP